MVWLLLFIVSVHIQPDCAPYIPSECCIFHLISLHFFYCVLEKKRRREIQHMETEYIFILRDKNQRENEQTGELSVFASNQSEVM